MKHRRTVAWITLCSLAAAADAAAFSWPWKKDRKAPSAESRAVPRIRIMPFDGGTGESAAVRLRDALLASGEVLPVAVGETAAHVITARSSGGRITGQLAQESGKEVFERTYAAPGLEENVDAFADDLVLAITGKPGLATSLIAFVSDATGQKQIYLCDADGGNVRQVTRHPHGCVSPTVSADGSLLAFTSYQSGFPTLMMLDLAGGSERAVIETPGCATGAAFSPDGRRLAICLSFLGAPEIFVTEMTGGTAACITETLGVPSGPSWHPRQSMVIFASDEGGGPQLFTAALGKNPVPARWRTGFDFCTDPEFSPDGRQVAFTASTGGELGVVIRDYPAGESRIVRGGGAQHPTWSPNGRYLAYAQGGSLWLHDLRNNERRKLVSEPGSISEPRWMK